MAGYRLVLGQLRRCGVAAGLQRPDTAAARMHALCADTGTVRSVPSKLPCCTVWWLDRLGVMAYLTSSHV